MTVKPPSDNHYQQIYGGTQTDLYDAMVLCEDVDNNLFKTLQPYLPPGGKLLDVGAGTGRVSRILQPVAGKILSTDLNLPMLRSARQHQQPFAAKWSLAAGDATELPVKTGWADLAIEGWALANFMGWFGDEWRGLMEQALSEMQRTTRGNVVLIETLGTGFEQPAPPHDRLAMLYEYWENQQGFKRTVIRTDYLFPDVATMRQLVSFFFGAELAQATQTERLIEWTGVWVR